MSVRGRFVSPVDRGLRCYVEHMSHSAILKPVGSRGGGAPTPRFSDIGRECISRLFARHGRVASMLLLLLLFAACDGMYSLLYPTAELTITNLTSHEVTGVYLVADDSISSYRDTENRIGEATVSEGTVRISGIARDIYTVVVELENGLIIEFGDVDLVRFDTYELEII